MFLKILHGDSVIKLVFKEELKDYAKFADLVSAKTGIKLSELLMTFKDVEGDTLHINDSDDLEYFVEQNKGSEFKELKVQRKLSDALIKPASEILVADYGETPDRKRRMTKVRGALDELTISTILYKDDPEEADDVTLGEFHFNESDNDKRKKSTDQNDGLKSIELCFAQMMSQFMEMKAAYEAKLNQIDDNQRRFEESLASVRSKLEVQGSSKTSNQLNTLLLLPHADIQCNSCGLMPIKGKRYKCVECKDFNLCAGCEGKDIHAHDMRRILPQIKTTEEEDELRGLYISKLKEEENRLITNSPVRNENSTGLPFKDTEIEIAAETKNGKENKLSLRDVISKHIQADREEYEKRKELLDATFGENITDAEKDGIIMKEQELSFEDFSTRIMNIDNLIKS